MKVLNKINSNHIELNKLKIRFFIQRTADIMGLFKGIFLPFCFKVFYLLLLWNVLILKQFNTIKILLKIIGDDFDTINTFCDLSSMHQVFKIMRIQQ